MMTLISMIALMMSVSKSHSSKIPENSMRRRSVLFRESLNVLVKLITRSTQMIMTMKTARANTLSKKDHL